MNREDIITLLQNIKVKTYVGTAGYDAISYSIEKGLIERTAAGNFKLSQKGEDVLNGKIDDKTIFP
jgi:hypothetical protein